MAIQNMNELFLHMLKDVYYAEKQIVKSLPKMASKVGEAKLKQSMEKHLEESKHHLERLEEVFQLVNQKPSGETCPAIDGIIKEAEEMMGEIKDANTRDAAIIAAAQAVEHYEITRYGTLIAWADELGLSKASTQLKKTLEEEKKTDALLTKLGEDRVNTKAKSKA
ncbi:DUF892 family protein [Fodinicurvata sp. EGI_FJ10296]|uniref:YciE/YciF ferroxidase family protein n=1 Tax=Fodinicurvata sp. EGI_FJ10296 TaxID=3231908 RepID=UPI003453B2F5